MKMPFQGTDNVTGLLYMGIWGSVLALIFVEFFFKDDSQLFQVIASVLTGFLGAFLGRVKPEGPPPGTITATHEERVTTTPPAPPTAESLSVPPTEAETPEGQTQTLSGQSPGVSH